MFLNTLIFLPFNALILTTRFQEQHIMVYLSHIVESFVQGGGGLSARGLSQILVNLLVTSLLVALVVGLGEVVNGIDYLDLVIETGTVIVAFGMFSFIAMIPLKRVIKRIVLSGLFLIQSGLLLDMLDECLHVPLRFWKLFGDGTFLMGMIVVAYGTANWVVYTYRMSTLDKLTNVYNRRFFESMVTQFLSRLERIDEPSCLMCMDIDDFKRINDSLGHSAGDDVLRVVADVLRDHARRSDVICRSGGEEFEFLLVGADASQAEEVAKRILTQLSNQKPAGVSSLTASIGITQLVPGDSIDAIRQRGDAGLYEAKRAGKACFKVV